MSSTRSDDAKEGAKNLNLGLPLTNKQIKAFADMFVEGKYFGHVEFGLKNKRLDPEDLLRNLTEDKVKNTGFLLFLGYLLRNGLDPNTYFNSPYNVKIHLAVYIHLMDTGNKNKKYIFDLLKSAGTSFSIPGSSGGRGGKGKSVGDAVDYDDKDILEDEEYSLTEFFKLEADTTSGHVGVDLKIKWKDFKNILLDQEFTTEDKKDIFDFLNKNTPDNQKFLMRTAVLFLSVTTGAVDCIRESRDDDMFLNSLGNMNQAAYISINSQNLEVFKNVIDKGAECNYLCITEIIARHNEAGERDDKILTYIYGEMLAYAVLTGSDMDKYQLQFLSLQASVELIEKVTTNYEEPEWKKACKRTIPGDKKQFPVKKLRQIAFNLNIDFNLSPSTICGKLEQISNIDRLDYAKGAILRQEERVKRALIEVGDIKEGDSLERTRCNAKSMLINNPYAYNDARMAFYRDDDGELWCFTSDLFEPMIKSKRNPYTNKKLPPLFIATIKTQLDILKFLDLNHPKDSKTISKAIEETFEKKGVISNEFSEDYYARCINLLRLYVFGSLTEATFRENSLNNKTNTTVRIIFEKFVNLSFAFSVSHDYMIHTDFKNFPANFFQDRRNCNKGNFDEIMETSDLSQAYFKIKKDCKLYKLFAEAKFIKNPSIKATELFYRTVAFEFLTFYNFVEKAEDSSSENYFLPNSKQKFFEECIKSIFNL
jgi:hypothetical protein